MSRLRGVPVAAMCLIVAGAMAVMPPVPVSAEVAGPDLLVTSIELPQEVTIFDFVSVQWTVTNIGTEATECNARSQFYQSRDAVITTLDAYLGEHVIPSLAPGESYSRQTSVNVRDLSTYGEQYVGMIADRFDLCDEGDESNNILGTQVTVRGPDLAVVSVTAPSVVSNGEPISLTWGGANVGPGAVLNAWRDRVLLSDDPAFGGAEVAKAGGPDRLLSGATYAREVPGLIPNVGAGDYHLRLLVDDLRQVAEEAEQNNAATQPVQVVNPDLRPVVLDVPPVLVSGVASDFAGRIENEGAGDAWPPWQDQFVLSRDETLDATDVLIGEIYRDTMVPSGGGYDVDTSFTTPDVAPGLYYVLLATDATDARWETGDDNNVLASLTVAVGTRVPV